MFKFSHVKLIFISGTMWLIIGISLLQLGISFLMQGLHEPRPLMNFFGLFARSAPEAAIAIIALCLYVGVLKGRFVLQKSAVKNVQRICCLPNPVSVHKIYSAKYYLLLAFMVLLGISLKYIGLPTDIRGAIDVAVGAALINGALSYYRQGWSLRRDF